MEALLEDLRLLKLADLHEGAYAAALRELADRHLRGTRAGEVAEELLAARARRAERVLARLQDVEGRVRRGGERDVERVALADVLDVSRAACRFYRECAAAARGRETAALFERLAAEEERGLRAAESALGLAAERDAAAVRAETRRALGSISEPTPLWEGTSEPRPPHP